MEKVSWEDPAVPIWYHRTVWRSRIGNFVSSVLLRPMYEKRKFIYFFQNKVWSHFCFGRFLWYIINISKLFFQKLLEVYLTHTCKNACRPKNETFADTSRSLHNWISYRPWMDEEEISSTKCIFFRSTNQIKSRGQRTWTGRLGNRAVNFWNIETEQCPMKARKSHLDSVLDSLVLHGLRFVDPSLREFTVKSWPEGWIKREWNDCGEKPPTPENAVAVVCDGPFCVAICPKGWRPEHADGTPGRWKIRCRNSSNRKRNFTWTHSEFSPCIER